MAAGPVAPAPAPAAASPWRRHLAWLAWLWLFNIAVGSCALQPLLSKVPDGTPAAGWVAVWLALVSTVACFQLLVAALLAGPVLAVRRRWFTLGVCPLLYAAVALMLYADTVLYRIWGFHLNRGVVEVLAVPGAGDSLLIGSATLWSAAGIALLLLAAETAFAFGVLGRRGARLPRARWLWAAAAAVAAVVLADKICYTRGDLADRPELTRARTLIPLYQVVTVKRLASRLGVRVAKPDEAPPRHGAALDYPKQALRFAPGAARPNVVVIAVEGFRADALDAQTMPFLHRWSADQLVYERHYSGGNATRFALFSLLYGLDGTYWHRFLAERQAPVLVTALQGLGYDFSVLSCTDLRFPEFRSTAFRTVPEAITDRWTCPRVERDRALTDRFLAFIAEERAAPFFAFLFYDAPHQPYLYPPEHELFTPVSRAEDLDYIKLATDPAPLAGPLRNRYRNALHYIDAQVERALHGLAAKGLLDDSLVFVLGDHGEEFGELGMIGHNNSFNDFQTRSAMIVHLPGQAPGRVTRMTCHIDLVPTVLGALGVLNPLGDYSQGLPLTAADPGPRRAVVASWDEAAVVDDQGVLVVGTESTSLGVRIYDPAYRLLDRPLSERREAMLELMRRMGEFAK